MLRCDSLSSSSHKQCTALKTLLWDKDCCILPSLVVGLCSLLWGISFTYCPFFFHLSLFLPSLGYTGDTAVRERKPLTRFLQIWKINKNVMNNANFSFSWVHDAVQEAGREQWGWITVRQWLFSLRWSRNCRFPGNIWNDNAAGLGGVHWEEPKPDSGISHKLLCHRGKQVN